MVKVIVYLNVYTLTLSQGRIVICAYISDISKRFREKDSEIIDAKTTISRLEGRIHAMELSAKKVKTEMDEELERYKRKQQRDKELVCHDCYLFIYLL